MRKELILTILGLFFISAVVEGADWYKITITSDGVDYYIDKGSIDRDNSNVKAWFKEGENKMYYKEFVCGKKKYRSLQTTDLFFYVPPESLTEAGYDYVCKKKD